jgi:hypothetical protein
MEQETHTTTTTHQMQDDTHQVGQMPYLRLSSAITNNNQNSRKFQNDRERIRFFLTTTKSPTLISILPNTKYTTSSNNMKFSIATLLVVSASVAEGFSPALFGIRSPTTTQLSATRVDSSALVKEALAASKKFGPASVEARLAWEAVEEVDASDNRYVPTNNNNHKKTTKSFLGRLLFHGGNAPNFFRIKKRHS